MGVIKKIGDSWKGANGFSRFLFVLNVIFVPATIAGAIMNVVKTPEVDYTKLTWKLKRDIDTWGKQGDIVNVVESDGVNFIIDYSGNKFTLTINELELA